MYARYIPFILLHLLPPSAQFRVRLKDLWKNKRDLQKIKKAVQTPTNRTSNYYMQCAVFYGTLQQLKGEQNESLSTNHLMSIYVWRVFR